MNKFDISNLDCITGSCTRSKMLSCRFPRGRLRRSSAPAAAEKARFLRTLNRMNDLVEGCKITGNVLLDGQDIYKGGMDTTALRKRVGMVFQNRTPFP